ncbi:MAG: hypothetical protein SGJ20_15770 [Planctomycetota bacterium]|nr:hypothetical protein [Planctomycetota bacterium]
MSSIKPTIRPRARNADVSHNAEAVQHVAPPAVELLAPVIAQIPEVHTSPRQAAAMEMVWQPKADWSALQNWRPSPRLMACGLLGLVAVLTFVIFKNRNRDSVDGPGISDTISVHSSAVQPPDRKLPTRTGTEHARMPHTHGPHGQIGSSPTVPSGIHPDFNSADQPYTPDNSIDKFLDPTVNPDQIAYPKTQYRPADGVPEVWPPRVAEGRAPRPADGFSPNSPTGSIDSSAALMRMAERLQRNELPSPSGIAPSSEARFDGGINPQR